MLILDIGCGKKKQDPAAIGLDRQPGSCADVLCDLGHFPWPLEDNCAGRIYLSHFLEHQPDILRAMAEVRRVAQPDAEIVIATPHYTPGIPTRTPPTFSIWGFTVLITSRGTVSRISPTTPVGSAFWSCG